MEVSHCMCVLRTASGTSATRQEMDADNDAQQQTMEQQTMEQRKTDAGIPGVRGCDPTYFDYYGMLIHTENMLQDAVRTGTYQSAALQNTADFADKVVLDVGAGSGILSYFACMAGARRVYAVEASSMADNLERLIAANGFADRIVVVRGKVEEVELPEKVDVIISEPIGVLLLHERMIESYLAARIKFLKLNGRMYPSSGDIMLSPFSDNYLYNDIMARARFWDNRSFYGVDLSCLREAARLHHFGQPVIGGFDANTLLSARPCSHTVDFCTATPEDLHDITIPLAMEVNATAVVHGLAGWFDIFFNGTQSLVKLTTHPASERTHWQQIRFLFLNPIAVNRGQRLVGHMHMKVNDQRSYDIRIRVAIEHNENVFTEAFYRLHQQNNWYYYPSALPAGEQDFKSESWGIYK